MDVFPGGYTAENAQAAPLHTNEGTVSSTAHFINDINFNPQLHNLHGEYIQVLDESSFEFWNQEFPLLDSDFDNFIGLSLEELSPVAPRLASNEACASSSSSAAANCAMQESSLCTLQPHVYDPSPSHTVYFTPPPSSTVVEMECALPSPASAASKNIVISPLAHHRPNSVLQTHNQLLNYTDFSPGIPPSKSAVYDTPTVVQRSSTISNFNSSPILLGDPSSKGFNTSYPVRKASAVDMNTDPNVNFVYSEEQITQLMMELAPSCDTSTCPDSRNPLQTIYTESMGYTGAVSESEAMELTSASGAAASTPSSYLMSTGLPHHGESLSAPVSPSLNYTAEAPQLAASFQYEVEDKGSVHGGSFFANKQEKTQYYKVNDKIAWKRAGGIVKRRQPRSKSHSVDPASVSVGQEHMNPDSILYQFRVKTKRVNLEDGYTWRKYGEKVIKKENYRRTYLKCDESERSGCTVLKRTQRCSKNDDYVHFLYLGRHNHDH